MKNQKLRTKTEYENFLLKLERNKVKLSTLAKDSLEYNRLLKKIISDTIFAKGHSFCLDNENERKKLSRVIYNLWFEIESLSKTSLSNEYRS